MNGNRQYSADLIQGGLEIPCLLIFGSKNAYEALKTKELLRSSLKLRVQPVDDIPEILKGCKTTVGSEQQSSQPQNGDSKCNTSISLSQYSKTEDKQAAKAVCVDAADLPQMPVDVTAGEGCSPPKKK